MNKVWLANYLFLGDKNMKCNQTILGQPELFELASLKHCLM